jgi:hypothetical protein
MRVTAVGSVRLIIRNILLTQAPEETRFRGEYATRAGIVRNRAYLEPSENVTKYRMTVRLYNALKCSFPSSFFLQPLILLPLGAGSEKDKHLLPFIFSTKNKTVAMLVVAQSGGLRIPASTGKPQAGCSFF